MSVENWRYLRCDNVLEEQFERHGQCESKWQPGQPGVALSQMRRQARSDGWHHMVGKDFCPDCYGFKR